VYGLPPGKVHVVPLAACIAESDYEDWEQQQIEKLPQMERALWNGEPLRLVLVGKDWHNKGLDRLLEAMKIGASRGLTATLLVIGCCEDDLPVELRGMPGVTYRGRLDKATASREFVDAVGECHIGCLLSRAEAAGIAVREYQALGLAVLGTDAGGSPEQIIPGAGIIVPRAAPPVEIANILLRLDADRPLLARMRSVAWENRTAMLWTTAFPKVSEILAVTSASRSVRCG
jgi:glycosyltransferase involved in cell wall biosynthesis